jgi:hypothetical protein
LACHSISVTQSFPPQVSFEINIITPFNGVTLEIGGAVETYWKSLAVPNTTPAAKAATPRLSRARQLGSAQIGSPTGSPIPVSSHAQPVTISSITGSYVYLTVQVTQDLQPVVFGEWQLPEQNFDLWVADVTLAQFEALARRKGRDLRASSSSDNNVAPSTLSEWHSLIRRSMVSLEHLLKVSYTCRCVLCVVVQLGQITLTTNLSRQSSGPGPDPESWLDDFFVLLNFIYTTRTKNNTTPYPPSQLRPPRRRWVSASNWHIRSRVPAPGRTPGTAVRSGIDCP